MDCGSVLPKSIEVAELLGDAEKDFALVDVAAIPLDELASSGDVFCDWLFG